MASHVKHSDAPINNASTIPLKDTIFDYDQDKNDPQYIPRKGTFYEHDDRISTSFLYSADEMPLVVTKKGCDEKVWSHDLYDPDQQSPKTREELIEEYGYDIRAEQPQ